MVSAAPLCLPSGISRLPCRGGSRLAEEPDLLRLRPVAPDAGPAGVAVRAFLGLLLRSLLGDLPGRFLRLGGAGVLGDGRRDGESESEQSRTSKSLHMRPPFTERVWDSVWRHSSRLPHLCTRPVYFQPRVHPVLSSARASSRPQAVAAAAGSSPRISRTIRSAASTSLSATMKNL